MTVPALAGFTIGVTADRRWQEQVELFSRRGARVLHGPTIKTQPFVPEGEMRVATESLIADPPDVVVFTTGVGTRAWFAAAESIGLGEALLQALGNATVHARGAKASGAATTAGLEVSRRAVGDRAAEIGDHLLDEIASGRLVARPERNRLRVAVQLDGSVDREVAERLASAGLDVVAVPVYRWTAPDDTGPAERLVLAVAERSVDAVTFTAAPAATGFFSIAEACGVGPAVLSALNSGSVRAVCIGPVCAGGVRQQGVTEWIEPRTPRLGALVHACTNALVTSHRSLRLAGHDVVVQGRMVIVNGNDPEVLSDRERGVLDALAERPGAVHSKSALLRSVWGSGEQDEHVVEVTVGRLRRRLGPAGAGVETVVRRGYRLAAN